MLAFKENGFVWISKFLVPLGILLLLIIYCLAVRPTIIVYQQFQESCVAGYNLEPLSVSPSYTASRAEQIKQIYNHFLIDTLSWKSQLWNSASYLSRKYNSKVTFFGDYNQENFGKQKLYKQRVGFSGSYVELIKLLDELEKTKGLGKISFLRLAKKPREAELTMEVDLSGIQKTKI